MKTQRASAIALLLAIVAVGPASRVALAQAQTVEAPMWRAGYKWTFRAVSGLPPVESTWLREVVELLPGGKFSAQTEAGKKLIFDGETNSLDSRGIEFSWKRFNFPLYVCKTWKHDRKLDDFGHETATWIVRAHESVTVPAGTFDCFRVDGVVWQTRTYAMYSPTTSYEDATYWYCPEVNWASKWKSRRRASSGSADIDSESVLTSFVGD